MGTTRNDTVPYEKEKRACKEKIINCAIPTVTAWGSIMERERENEVSSTKEERKRKVKESERKKRKEREREQWEANIKVSRECGKWLWWKEACNKGKETF